MNRKLPQGRPLSGFYIVIFCPYSAQIPLIGEGQLKLLVSKPLDSRWIRTLTSLSVLLSGMKIPCPSAHGKQRWIQRAEVKGSSVVL